MLSSETGKNLAKAAISFRELRQLVIFDSDLSKILTSQMLLAIVFLISTSFAVFIRTWSLCTWEMPFSICFHLLSTSLEITTEVLATCLSSEGVEERLLQEDEDPSRSCIKQST